MDLHAGWGGRRHPLDIRVQATAATLSVTQVGHRASLAQLHAGRRRQLGAGGGGTGYDQMTQAMRKAGAVTGGPLCARPPPTSSGGVCRPARRNLYADALSAFASADKAL